MKRALLASTVALLVGCATQQPSYISRATPEDIARCQAAKNGCTVWTDAEVNGYTDYVVQEVMRQLGIGQRGRSL